MPIRLCKIALVFASFFFLLLVVFNNLTDYGSNFAFVSHVLSMDTTFPDNQGRWRAMPGAAIHHAFYAMIILWEAIACVLTGIGVWRLWQSRRLAVAAWQQAKTFAAVGLTVSMLQWYLAFLCVGAEWFLMWQSKIWNGQDAAFRMFSMMAASLIFLMLRDEEGTATT